MIFLILKFICGIVTVSKLSIHIHQYQDRPIKITPDLMVGAAFSKFCHTSTWSASARMPEQPRRIPHLHLWDTPPAYLASSSPSPAFFSLPISLHSPCPRAVSSFDCPRHSLRYRGDQSNARCPLYEITKARQDLLSECPKLVVSAVTPTGLRALSEACASSSWPSGRIWWLSYDIFKLIILIKK